MDELLEAATTGNRTHGVDIASELPIVIEPLDQILRYLIISNFNELIRDDYSHQHMTPWSP